MVININKVSLIKGRPYSLSLEGYFGHNKFKAELQGACLEILTATPFNDEQKRSIEMQLQDLFPPPLDGKFKRKDINNVMKVHDEFIQIKVEE